jgi:hypothetical protein
MVEGIPRNIITEPDDYHKIKEKYLQREEEQLKKVLAKRGAKTTDDLEKVATQALGIRATRAASEHKPLKDHTILTEPKNPEIAELRSKIDSEINELSQRILKDLPKNLIPSLEKKVIGLTQLKGRISQNPPNFRGNSEEVSEQA